MGSVMIGVGGPVVVVVVVGGGTVIVVVVVVVATVVVVVVVVDADLPAVVVVLVVVVLVTRFGVVVVVETTGVGPSRFGADAGAVAALVVGVPSVESNLPAKREFTDAATGFTDVAVVVVFGGLATEVGVEVAEAVLGAAAFVVVNELVLLSDGGVSLCTNPT